jgi:hypothetical protein
MEILKAFDLVGTLREAAKLVGVDHYVAEREAAGGEWRRRERERPRSGPFYEKVAQRRVRWPGGAAGALHGDRRPPLDGDQGRASSAANRACSSSSI